MHGACYAAKGRNGSLRLVEAVVADVPMPADTTVDRPEGALSPAMTQQQPLEVHLLGGARMLVNTTHQAALAAHVIQALSRPC